LKGGDHFGDLGEDVGIILKLILKKESKSEGVDWFHLTQDRVQ
jgi:hypothetical protein